MAKGLTLSPSTVKLFEAACYVTGTVSELCRFQRRLVQLRSGNVSSNNTLPIVVPAHTNSLSPSAVSTLPTHTTLPQSTTIDGPLVLLLATTVVGSQRFDLLTNAIAALYTYNTNDGATTGLRHPGTAAVVGAMLSDESASAPLWANWGSHLRTIVRNQPDADLLPTMCSAIRLGILYSSRRASWVEKSTNPQLTVVTNPPPQLSKPQTWVEVADMYRCIETFYLDALSIVYGSSAATQCPVQISKHFTLRSKPMTGAQFAASFLLAIERAVISESSPAVADIGKISPDLLLLWSILEASDVMYFTSMAGPLPSETATWRAACLVGAELLRVHLLPILPSIVNRKGSASYQDSLPTPEFSVSLAKSPLFLKPFTSWEHDLKRYTKNQCYASNPTMSGNSAVEALDSLIRQLDDEDGADQNIGGNKCNNEQRQLSPQHSYFLPAENSIHEGLGLNDRPLRLVTMSVLPAPLLETLVTTFHSDEDAVAFFFGLAYRDTPTAGDTAQSEAYRTTLWLGKAKSLPALTISRAVLAAAAIPLLKRLRKASAGSSLVCGLKAHELAICIFRACKRAPANSLTSYIASLTSMKTVNKASPPLIKTLPMKLLVEVLRHTTGSPKHALAFYGKFIKPTYGLSEGVLPLLSLVRSGRLSVEQAAADQVAGQESATLCGQELVLLALSEYLRLGTSTESVISAHQSTSSSPAAGAHRNKTGLQKVSRKLEREGPRGIRYSDNLATELASTTVSDRLSMNAKSEFTRAIASANNAGIFAGTKPTADTNVSLALSDDILDHDRAPIDDGFRLKAMQNADKFHRLVAEVHSARLLNERYSKGLPIKGQY